jgi:hypothetical protein
MLAPYFLHKFAQMRHDEFLAFDIMEQELP